MGPALTAVWSKVLPLTAHCLSPLPGFESWPGHVRKLPVTWGLGVVFAGYSGFLHHIQLASHNLATFGINVTKSKIPNPNQLSSVFLFWDSQGQWMMWDYGPVGGMEWVELCEMV